MAAVPATRRRPLPGLAGCGDGLVTGNRPARVEVQNPPYARVRLTPVERERWRHVLYGHANLYALFVAAALEDLDDQGVLAELHRQLGSAGVVLVLHQLAQDIRRRVADRELD